MPTRVRIVEHVEIHLDLGDTAGTITWNGSVNVGEARNVVARLRESADKIESALDARGTQLMRGVE